MNAPQVPAVVAVDTGGTFTDLVLLVGGRIERLKVPSTPSDPAEAVLQGLREILSNGRPFSVIHGSTVATNALLERKGARVALVTNRGFEDVIEIGRQNRPQLYALVGHRPPPLVGREDRIGIAGRLDHLGKELEPLDAAELESLNRRLGDVDAVAVVLLHSYANPAHERAVKHALEGGTAPVSASIDILPEYREYERTSTTVVNAYVLPLMSGYLARIEAEAGAERVSVMGSNGGVLAIGRARSEPVHTVLSGPAGGAVGALAWGRLDGAENLISFDMGGTSTDVALCPGALLHSRELSIGGQPIAVPVIDIHTVGAGGGSIARVDAGGALHVGPDSAGAEPGPICYGLGGVDVTVTDAHVWLGRLPASGFLGGERELDRDAVAPRLADLARQMGITPEDAAEGILRVAASAMVRALRVISVERGFDPRDFTLVAFGGAGGLHAAELARSLGAAGALVPPDPGLLSAYGMLAAPLRREAVRTLLVRDDDHDVDAAVADALAYTDRAAREGLLADTGSPHEPSLHRQLDVRYHGQSFELRVDASGWREGFHGAHGRRYGYERRDWTVEVVTVRTVAELPGPALSVEPLPDARGDPATETTRVWTAGGFHEATEVWRCDLRPGHRLVGPGVILDYSGTTWVPPGWSASVARHGSLLLRQAREGSA